MSRNLHKYFYPTQGVTNTTNSINKEILPCSMLRPYICCYWGSDCKEDFPEKIKPYWDTVLPDNCTDIIFEIDVKHSTYKVIYCGMFDKPFYVYHDNASDLTETFAIRFFPGGAFPFLKLPLVDFKNKIIDMNDVWRKFVSVIGESILKASAIYARIAIVNNFLLKTLSDRPSEFDNCTLDNLIFKVFECKGLITVSELADSEIVSVRQINRIFEKRVGVSPNIFCRIVRFQNILKEIEDEKPVDWLTLTYKYNFFDQSHFAKEFKRFYGISPSAALIEDLSDFYNKNNNQYDNIM